MEHLRALLDLLLHVDRYLLGFVQDYGALVYVLLFAIIFVETGLVVMPFLPGDSLLFVAGAMAGAHWMSLFILWPLLFVAAVLGDALNFTLGGYARDRLMHLRTRRWFRQDMYDAAHAYFEQYGPVTVVTARFMPFIRTFVPFVAGVAGMSRRRFTPYNAMGGLLWVSSLLVAGYFFGNLAWVQAHLSVIIYSIVGISLLPVVMGWLRRRQAQSQAARQGESA